MKHLLVAFVGVAGCCTASVFAEQPTREAVVAYNDECKAAGVQADFVAKFGTDFAGLDLSGVNFSGPNLRGVNFRGANLRFAKFHAAVLDRASFQDADLRHASFNRASLQYVNLRGAKFAFTSIHKSNLAHANARGVEFLQVGISGSNFAFANLQGAKLIDATNDHSRTSFEHANLAGADLSYTRLHRGNFQFANLRGANLTWVELIEADFTGAELAGAEFDYATITHADFRHARGLSDIRRRELESLSGRAKWVRERRIRAILDSPWFALLLVAVIPALAGGYHWATRRSAIVATGADEAAPPARFQFSIAGLLAATLAIAAFVGVALWSARGLFSLAMVAATYLMADPILYDPQRRKSAARLVGCAVIYAVLTIAVALILFKVSSGFVVLWLAFGILMGPVVMVVAAGIWAAQAGKVSRLAITGFILWMLGLGFVNLLWLGAIMAAH